MRTTLIAVSAVVLLLMVSVAAFGQDPTTPPAVQGTGADVLAWFIKQFGIPGGVFYTLYRAGGIKAGWEWPTLRVEHHFGDEDRALIKKLVREVADVDSSSDSPAGTELVDTRTPPTAQRRQVPTILPRNRR